MLGMSQTTFMVHKKKYPELVAAIAKGTARDLQLCVNLLRQIAFDPKHKGQMTALIFYLKTRHGFIDRPQQLQLLPTNINLKKKIAA